MKIYFLIPLFFIFSCSSSSTKIPKDIIQKEAMIALFVDVHISDALVTKQKIKDVKESNQLKKSYLVGVLEKHNVSMLKYEKSNAFYEENIELMHEMYNEVMVKISEQEAELEGEKKTEKVK